MRLQLKSRRIRAAVWRTRAETHKLILLRSCSAFGLSCWTWPVELLEHWGHSFILSPPKSIRSMKAGASFFLLEYICSEKSTGNLVWATRFVDWKTQHHHQLNTYHVFGADLGTTFLFCMTKDRGKRSMETTSVLVVPSWASTRDICLPSTLSSK